MKAVATHLRVVWRFVADRAAPTTAAQADADAATREHLVWGHESAASSLSRLEARGFLVSRVVAGTPHYWFSAGCQTPKGEHRREPYAHPSVASARTDATRQPGAPRVITSQEGNS